MRNITGGFADHAADYNLMPLMAERYMMSQTSAGENTAFQQGRTEKYTRNFVDLEYYAVAVVRKGSGITIDNLAEKRACHTGVGRAAGWVLPISRLIEDEHMPIVECNVPVKSAAGYFGDMCAPNALARLYNPFGLFKETNAVN